MRYKRVQSLLFLLVLITSVPQLSERKERKAKCEKDRTVAWDISVLFSPVGRANTRARAKKNRRREGIVGRARARLESGKPLLSG